MNNCSSQSPHDYDFDGNEVGTSHYDMMVATIHREREAQTDYDFEFVFYYSDRSWPATPSGSSSSPR